jgi:hypothetical protein
MQLDGVGRDPGLAVVKIEECHAGDNYNLVAEDAFEARRGCALTRDKFRAS